MTPILCAQSVADMLQKEFEGYVSTEPKTANNGITICTGFLAKTRTAAEKQTRCPRIVIRPVKVTNSEDSKSTVELQILTVTYCEDMDDGHMELYNLMERVRQAVLFNRIVADMNLLQLPVESVVPEEQPWPCWWGWMNASYDVPQTVNNQELIKYVYKYK